MSALVEALFAGPIAYKVGYGPYGVPAAAWTYVDVPAVAARRDTAQAVRKNAAAQSARMFAYDAQGHHVFWYFGDYTVGGGAIQCAKETVPEAREYLNQLLATHDVLAVQVRRVTTCGDQQTVVQASWERAEAGAVWGDPS